MQLKKFWSLARKSVDAWVDDYAPSMGAAISYYTVFSLAPLLLIVIAVAGAVWGRDAVQGEIVSQLNGLLGQEAAEGIQGLLVAASEPTRGIVATVIGFCVLAFGATTVFAELQSALDRIWQVPDSAKKSGGLMKTVRARLLSFGLVLGLGFLLIVSLVTSAAVAAFGSWAEDVLPAGEFILLAINVCVSIGITTLMFAMIFKLMPQARVAWQDVWVGAAVTAVMLEVGKLLIGLYLGKSSVTSSFAAAGSVVVVLVWVYYAAQIFLLGAEFTWVYAQDHGSRSRHGQQTVRPVAQSSQAAAATSLTSIPSRTAPPVAAVSAPVAPAPVAKPPRVDANASVAQIAGSLTKDKRLSLGSKAAIVGTATVLQLLIHQAMRNRRRLPGLPPSRSVPR